MKILVTGATGYVGNKLALTLAAQGNKVNVLVRNDGSVNVPLHSNIRVFAGDITDRQSISAAIFGCEQVYHTAAYVKFFSKDPAIAHRVNVEGTKNMLEEALEAGVDKFVFTSSCGVIGPTLSAPMCENDQRIIAFDDDYEYTKFLAENLVKEYNYKGMTTVIVSLTKVYGPGIETRPISVNQVIKRFVNGGITFIPSPGTFTTNYCFIDDVVEGHVLAMTRGAGGEKYILGGENISFIDLFHTIRALSGTRAKLLETPKVLIQLWAVLQWIKYKITKQDPFVTAKGVKHIFCNKTFNSGKAIQQLGYHITPIKEGLHQTIQFLKS